MSAKLHGVTSRRTVTIHPSTHPSSIYHLSSNHPPIHHLSIHPSVFCLSVRPSVCLSLPLSVRLSLCPPFLPSPVLLSVLQSVRPPSVLRPLSVRPPSVLRPSVRPSVICPPFLPSPVHQSVRPPSTLRPSSARPSVLPSSVRPSVCLSV